MEGFGCSRVGTILDTVRGSRATRYFLKRRSTSRNIHAPDIPAFRVGLANVRKKMLRALPPLAEQLGQVKVNHVNRQVYVSPGNARKPLERLWLRGTILTAGSVTAAGRIY